jgi:hypothetical protein
LLRPRGSQGFPEFQQEVNIINYHLTAWGWTWHGLRKTIGRSKPSFRRQ